jgi:hypothetical protein
MQSSRKGNTMSRQITWNDCVQACDDLIETIKLKMQEEPEHGQFWQERMDWEMYMRENYIVLAREQRRLEEEQFKQSLQIVCYNVLENVRRQQS